MLHTALEMKKSTSWLPSCAAIMSSAKLAHPGPSMCASHPTLLATAEALQVDEQHREQAALQELLKLVSNGWERAGEPGL